LLKEIIFLKYIKTTMLSLTFNFLARHYYKLKILPIWWDFFIG
jgi:hypothetical protein